MNASEPGRANASAPRWGWAFRHPWLLVGIVAVFNAIAWYGFSRVVRHRGLDWHLLVIAIFVVAGLAMITVAELVIRQRRVVLLVESVLMLSAITCLFSTIYYLNGDRGNWNIPLGHADSIYVALGTLTAVGSTGIAPRTGAMRELLAFQMGVDVIVVIGIFGLVVAQIASGLGRQDP